MDAFTSRSSTKIEHYISFFHLKHLCRKPGCDLLNIKISALMQEMRSKRLSIFLLNKEYIIIYLLISSQIWSNQFSSISLYKRKKIRLLDSFFNNFYAFGNFLLISRFKLLKSLLIKIIRNIVQVSLFFHKHFKRQKGYYCYYRF